MITPEEMQAIVGPMREYIDARIGEVDERIVRMERALNHAVGRIDVDLNEISDEMDEIEHRVQSHEDRLNHPALVLDYRAWVIEVAVGLGVTAKELVDAKKKLREDGDDPRSAD